jgi:hypothetical protein
MKEPDWTPGESRSDASGIAAILPNSISRGRRAAP